MKGFLDNFYNMDVLGGTLVSDQAFQANWNIAASASATAAVACVPTWETDFRADLPKIDVPMLVIQSDADRILPFPNTGKRLPGLIKCNWPSSAVACTPSPGPTASRSTKHSSPSSNGRRAQHHKPLTNPRPVPNRSGCGARDTTAAAKSCAVPVGPRKYH